MERTDTLTAAEAAAALRCSRTSLYKLIARGRIRATRPLGPRGEFRIPRSEIDRLLGDTEESTESNPHERRSHAETGRPFEAY